MLVTIFSAVVFAAMLLVFLRFVFQLTEMDPYSPFVIYTYRATKIVDVFARIFPTVARGRVSLAAIVILILLRFIGLTGENSLAGIPAFTPVELLSHTVFSLSMYVLKFCQYVILASVIMSWIAMLTQSTPAYMDFINRLAEPLLAPIRKLLPDTGPLDFSPIVALLGVSVCQRILETVARTMGMVF